MNSLHMPTIYSNHDPREDDLGAGYVTWINMQTGYVYRSISKNDEPSKWYVVAVPPIDYKAPKENTENNQGIINE